MKSPSPRKSIQNNPPLLSPVIPLKKHSLLKQTTTTFNLDEQKPKAFRKTMTIVNEGKLINKILKIVTK